MRRSRVIGGLIGLALAVGALTAVVLFIFPTTAQWEHRPQFGPDESQPIGQTHVGKTREQLIADLGQPTWVGTGQIGKPRQEIFDKYPGLQTLAWEWPSGRFLASIYPVQGRWVCFNSWWLPKGAVID